MEQQFDYEEIRCYEDRDIAGRLEKLADVPAIQQVVQQFMPDIELPKLKAMLAGMTSIQEFQSKIIGPFVRRIAAKACDSLDIKGLELINTEHAAVYITNHRDIVMDSAFLNTLLNLNGYITAEIAIGDNLLAFPWIRDLVRFNKSFIVMRSVPVRQMLEVSKRLSSYIHYAINDKKDPVWIAQREGRSKDCSDKTQASVVKMLALGGKTRSILENVKELNLQPVALSYEFDPCDYLKAAELQMKRDDPNFKKAPGDDLKSMATGILGYKGRVVLRITPELNPLFATLPADMEKNAQANAVCEAVDKALHSNMELYPINYVAYGRKFDTDKYADKYTKEEGVKALEYLNGQLAKIDIPNRDEDFLWNTLLTMYANPIVNMEALEAPNGEDCVEVEE